MASKSTAKKTTVKLGKSSSSGTMVCNICHGTGRVTKPSKKKK